MPYKDFTEELTRLQSANIGAGFILQAQAEAMKRQDQATINTMALFNQSKSNLDNELRTTDEQLKEIQESDVFKEGVDTIDKMASNYEAMLNTSLIRQQRITDIYQKTAQDLTQIGSKESLSLAEGIYKDLPAQLRNEENRSKIPLQVLEVKRTILDLSKSKLDIQKSELDLKQAKMSADAMSLASQIVTTESWGRMLKKLKAGDGNREYIAERDRVFQEMRIKYPDIDTDTFNKAAMILDEKIEKNRIDYSYPKASGTNPDTAIRLMQLATNVADQFRWFRDKTKSLNSIERGNDSTAAELRQAYTNAAVEMLQRKNIPLDSPEAQKYLNVGSSKEVIEYMQSVGAGDIPVFYEGMSRKGVDVLYDIYTSKYDLNSDKNYFKLFNTFKSQLKDAKGDPINVTPLRPLTEDEKSQLIKDGRGDELTNLHGRPYGKNIVQVQIGSETIPLFMGSIMMTDTKGNWYNPEDMEVLRKYTETSAERELRLKQEEARKREKKMNEELGKMPKGLQGAG